MTHRALNIIIVSGFPLSMEPRVVKEATAYADAGHHVTVLTSILDPGKSNVEKQLASEKWRTIYLVDRSLTSLPALLKWLLLRARRKFWLLLYQYLGISNGRQLGYTTPELLSYCLRHEADLYSLHLEPALWVGSKLAKLDKVFSVDFEDWYSEDLLDEHRVERPVRLIKSLEVQALEHSAFSIATSNAMASAISSAYTAKLPSTVYNCFPLEARHPKPAAQQGRLKICWPSQTVGPGRGLEELLAGITLHNINCEVHLIGLVSDSYRETLTRMAATPSMLAFHGMVPPESLVTYLTQFDVGYAGETNVSANRRLTITNKLFQYMLAGLPVIASRTPGQQEIADLVPEAIQSFYDVQSLAAAITFWQSPSNHARGSEAAHRAAETKFNWNIEKQKLLELVNRHIK